jgi:putative membrane protein
MLSYHMTSDSTKFGGEGVVKYVYYFILFTHIILSVIIIPLVLITYVRALAQVFDKHKKIAKSLFQFGCMLLLLCCVVYFSLLCQIE